MNQTSNRRPWTQWVARLMLALQFVQPMVVAAQQTGAAAAQIAPATNAPAGKRPIVDAAANGVPIVHIAPPSAAGVSHNQYEQFNVGTNGLILNNSLSNTQTQLGGWITPNLQLGTQQARIILNEVTSTNPSQIRGFIEVAGQRADIIIANPNGITCDGCGFINTGGRATLTTGKPELDASGAVTGFNVGQGQITVGSGGLNASNLDQLDLLARGLVIEGEIWAKDLRAVIGANQVLYGTLQATAQSGSGAAPKFAIDIANLGGMYANQIYLIATDKGLGVNSTGRIAAIAGNLNLSANGDLTLKDTYAQQDIQLKSGGDAVKLTGETRANTINLGVSKSLTNSGTLQAQDKLVISTDRLSNSGTLVQNNAARALVLDAKERIDNTGTIYAPSEVRLTADTVTGTDGKVISDVSVAIRAETIDFKNQQVAANQAVTLIAGNGGLNNSGGTFQAGGNLVAQTSGNASLSGATLQAQGNVTLDGRNVLAQGTKLEANGAVDVKATEYLDATDSVVAAQKNITLQAASVDAGQAKLSSLSNVAVQADTSIQAQGLEVAAAGTLKATAQNISLGQAKLYSEGASQIQAKDTLDLSQAQVAARGDIALTGSQILASKANVVSDAAISVSAQDTNLSASVVSAAKTISLQSDKLVLDDAKAIAGTTLTVGGNTLQAQHATLAALQNVDVQTVATADLRQSSVVSDGQVQIKANGVQSHGAQIVAPKVVVDAGMGALTNQGGTVFGNDVVVKASGIDNSAGSIGAKATLALDAKGGDINNTGGVISAPNSQITNAGQISNRGGTLYSSSDLSFSGSGLDNAGGVIATAGKLSIQTTSQTVDNTQGTLQSGGDLTIQSTGAALNNQGGHVTSGANLNIQTVSVQSNNGSLQAGGAINITTSSLDLSSGQLASGGASKLQVGGVANLNDANVQVQGGLTLAAGTLNALQGRLVSNGAMQLAASSAELAGAVISAKGDLDLTASTLNASGATVASGQSLRLDVGSVAGGTYSASGDIALNATQGANLSGGGLLAGGALTVNSQGLTTSGGQLSGSTVTVNTGAGRLNNAGGKVIATSGTLTVNAAGIDNQGGALSATGAATLNANGSDLNNVNGTITAGGTLSLQVGRIDNHGGTIASASAFEFDGQALDNAGGTLSSGQTLRINTNGQILDNTGGKLLSQDALTLSGGTVLNAGGTFASNAVVTVTATTLDNAAGTISGSGPVQIVVANSLASSGGHLQSGDTLTVTSQTLDLSQGTASAQGSLSLQSNLGANLTGSTVQSGGNLSIVSQSGDVQADQARIASNGNLQLNAVGNLNAAGAALSAMGQVQVDVQQTLNLAGGTVESGGVTRLVADAIDADHITINSAQSVELTSRVGVTNLASSTVTAGTTMAISGQGIVVSSAALSAKNDLLLQAGTGDLNHALSLTRSETGSITVRANQIDAHGVVGSTPRAGFIAGGNLDIQATGNVRLDGGSVVAGNNLVVTTQGDVNNSQGVMAAGGTGTVTASSLTNGGGIIDAQGALAVTFTQGELNNQNGRISTRGALSLSSPAGLDNTGGLIQTAESLNLVLPSLKNQGGNITALQGLTIVSGAADNRNGTLASGGNLSLNTQGQTLESAGGTLLSDGQLTIQSGAANLDAARVRAAQGLTLTTTHLTAQSAGLSAAGGNLVVNSQTGTLNLASATLQSSAAVTVTGGVANLNDVQLSSQGNTRLQTGALDLQRAQVVSGGSLDLLSTGAVNASASTMAANGAVNIQGLSLQAQRIESGSDITVAVAGAATLDGGRMVANGNVDLQSQGLFANSTVIAATTVTLNAGSGTASTRQSTIMASSTAAQALSLTAIGLDNAGGTIASNGGIGIDAGTGSLNNAAGNISSNGVLTVRAGDLNNQTGRIVGQNQLTVQSAALDNSAGGYLATGGSLAVTATTINNNQSQMLAGGSLTATASAGDISTQGGTVAAGSALTLTTSGALDSRGATVTSGSSMNLQAGSTWNNQGGTVQAGADLQATAAGAVSNQSGQVVALGALTLSGQGVDNTNGQIAANNAVQVQGGSGNVLNQGGSLRSALAEVTVSGADINNTQGLLQAATSLQVNATGAVNNAQAQITAATNLSIQAGGALDNQGAAILAGGSANIHSQGLNNVGGVVAANGNVQVDAGSGELDNRGSTIRSANGSLTLNAGSVDNRASNGARGTLSAATQLTMTSAGAVRNDGSSIVAADTLQITAAGALGNADGEITAGGTATLSGQGFDNQHGTLAANGDVSLNAGTGAVNNTSGILRSAQGNLTVQGGNLSNGAAGSQLGTIAAANDIRITATGDLDNRGNSIAAGRDLILSTTGAVLNAGGTLVGVRDASITSNGLTNDNGLVGANRNTTLNAGTGAVSNVQGQVVAGQDLVVQTTAAFDNHSGTITANGTATLTTGAFNNQSGSLVGLNGLSLDIGTSALNVNEGQLASNGNLTLRAGAVQMAGARFAPGGNLSIQGTSIDASRASIESGGSVTLNAGTGALALDNATVAANQSITLAGADVDVQNSVLGAQLSSGTIAVTGTNINANGLRVQTPGSASINASNRLSYRNGQFAAGNNLSIIGQSNVDGTGSSLLAGNNLTIGTDGLFRFDGVNFSYQFGNDLTILAQGISTAGFNVSGNNITLDARNGALDNRNGTISASGSVYVRGAGVNNQSSTILANQGVTVDAGSGTLNNTGASIASTQGSVSLGGNSINNQSGSVSAAQSVSISGGSLSNAGSSIVAGNGLSVQLSGNLDNSSGGQLIANSGAASVQAQGIDNRSGTLRGDSSLNVSAGSSTLNNNGGLISSSGDTTASGYDVINNAGGSEISGRSSLYVVGTGSVQNQGGSMGAAAGSVTIGAGSFTNGSGASLSATSTLSITANYLDNTGTLVANGDVDVTGRNALNNVSGGRIVSNTGNVALAGASITNASGSDVNAAQGLSISSTGVLVNNNSLYGGTSVTIGAGQVQNTGTIGAASGALSLQATSLDNTSGKIIAANGSASVSTTAGGLYNSGGVISATNSVDVSTNGNALNNAGGVISGLSAVSLQTGALNNDAGVIESGTGGIQINTGAQELTNTNSGTSRGIVSRGNVQISAGNLNNAGGYVGADGSLTVNAATVSNGGGTLLALASTTVNATTAILNQAGKIQAGQDVSLTAPLLDNSSGGSVFAARDLTVTATTVNNSATLSGGYTTGLLAGRDATINAETINNSNGAIVAVGNATVKAGTLLSNVGGQIGGDTVVLEAPTFTNTSGRVDAQRSLATSTPNFSADGVMASNGGITMLLQGDYTNTGTVATQGNFTVTTSGTYTNQGTVSATDTLNLNAGNLNNEASGRIVAGATNINVSGTVNNAGLINSSTGTTKVVAGTLNNTGRIYGNDVDLQVGTLNNESSATVASRGYLSIAGSTVNNRNGATISSQGDASITATLNNNGGDVIAGGNLTIGGTVNNTNANLVIAAGTPVVTAANTVYITPAGETTKYLKSDLRFIPWVKEGAGGYMRPSAQYPFDTFGFTEKLPYSSVAWDIDTNTMYLVYNYADTDPVWALFGVPPPNYSAVPPEPVLPAGDNCMTLIFGEFEPQSGRNLTGACGAYWAQYDARPPAIEQARTIAGAALDSAITSFNSGLGPRTFIEDWREFSTLSQTVTADRVVSSAPGRILAGGNLTVSGGASNIDSEMRGGGAVNVSGSSNIIITATPGTVKSTDTIQSKDFYVQTHYDGLGRRQDSTREFRNTTVYVDAEKVTTAPLDTYNRVGPIGAPTNPGNAQPGTGASAQVPNVGASLAVARGPNGTGAGAGNGNGAGTSVTNTGASGNTAQGNITHNGPTLQVAGVGVNTDTTNAGNVSVNGNGAGSTVTPGAGNAVSTGTGAGVSTGNTNLQVIAGNTTTVTAGAASVGTPTGPGALSTGTAVNTPLPGSVIAAGARATQLSAITSATASFSNTVSARATLATLNAAGGASGGASLNGARTSNGARPNVALATGPGYRTVASTSGVRAPNSNIYSVNPASGAAYLVETDPEFTNQQSFVSSDYFATQLAMDPSQLARRYGDGYAEQRLVDDQTMALTGRRFLSGYSNTEEQFAGLMDAGVTYAREYQLTPGVALSAEQMALLTTDMVWMEMQTITLADGSTTQALAPRVYLRRPADGDLAVTGALISGSQVNITSTGGNIQNTGTVLAYGGAADGTTTPGKVNLTSTTGSVFNGGTLAGNTVSIQAGLDINNHGGAILGLGADSSVRLNAGRDITIRTTTVDTSATTANSVATRTAVDRIATVSAGSVSINAGNNIALTGARIDATQGDLTLGAGGNITATSIAQSHTLNVATGGSVQGQSGYIKEDSTNQFITSLGAANNLIISAGIASQIANPAVGNIKLQGTNLSAGNSALLQGNNIAISAAINSQTIDNKMAINSNNGSSLNRTATLEQTLAGGAVTTGNGIAFQALGTNPASGSIALTGVNISGGQVSLVANNAIDIAALTTEATRNSNSFSESSGLLSSSSQTSNASSKASTVNGSQISGTSVALQAGLVGTDGKLITNNGLGNINITGSQISAVQNLQVNAGNNLSLASAAQTSNSTSHTESHRSGISLTPSLEGPYADDKTSANKTFSASTDIGSTLRAGGNLIANAGNNLTGTAVTLTAGGSTSLSAQGNLVLQEGRSVQTGSADISASHQAIFSGTELQNRSSFETSTALGNTITGATGIDLQAQNGTLALSATSISSSAGNVRLSGADVILNSALNSSTSNSETHSSRSGITVADLTATFKPGQGLGAERKDTVDDAQSTVAQTSVQGQNVSITSTGGKDSQLSLGAVNIIATGNSTSTTPAPPGTVTLDAGAGTLNLQTLQTSTAHAVSMTESDLAWQGMSGSGAQTQSTVYNQINGQLGMTAAAIHAEGKAPSLKQATTELASQPGMAWLGQIQNDPALAAKVDWTKLEEIHKDWHYEQSGLTGAGAAILAIVVTYFTAGMGTTAVAGATATTASTATVGGMALTSTAATGAMTYTAAGAAINAGFTALASQAAVGLINNGGDIGKTLAQMGSEDSVKNLLTTMVTAGAMTNIAKTMGWDASQSATGQTGAGAAGANGLATTQAANQFTQNLIKNVTNNVTGAAISAAINGKPFDENMLSNALSSALITAGAASGANAIGDAATPGANGTTPLLNTFTQAVAHAVLGCAVGTATASNASGCAPGAVGAAVGELTAHYANASGLTPNQAAQLGKVLAAVSGAIVGGGDNVEAVNIAATTGANAVDNNYLKHTQWAQLADKLKSCTSEDECSAVRKEYVALSAKQDAELRKACENINSTACRSQLAEVQAGTLMQKELIDTKKLLPANYYGPGGDFNANANSIVRKAIISDIRSVCDKDPSCTAKKQESLVKIASLALDFTPIIGDIKGFVEAETPFDYVLATVGAIGGPAGDSLVKVLREGKAAYKTGDVAAAAAKLEEAKSIRNVMDQTAVVPSLSGSISKGKLGSEAIAVPTPAIMRPSIEDIRINGDITGHKTENLVNVTLHADPGMVVLDGIKYGSDNGLDHVVQFVDPQTNKLMTMIIDSKQLAKNGTTSLDPNAAGGVMQLSDNSLNVVMQNIGKSPATEAIRNAQFDGTLVKAVAYVDKSTGQLKIVPVRVPNPTK